MRKQESASSLKLHEVLGFIEKASKVQTRAIMLRVEENINHKVLQMRLKQIGMRRFSAYMQNKTRSEMVQLPEGGAA